MTPELERLTGALASRALNTIDARRWLLRLDERSEREGWLLIEPDFPLVDSDGDPVEVAFVWNDEKGQPCAVVEFTDALITYRIFGGETKVWHPLDERAFIAVLSTWHADGTIPPRALEPGGPMETLGVSEPEGGLGVTVIRGGVQIPVDPDKGLPAMDESSDIGEEAERFLKEQGGD